MADKSKAVAEIPKFEIHDLRAKCGEIFKVDTCVFDGALQGKVGKMSVAEAEKTINTWLKKEVGK